MPAPKGNTYASKPAAERVTGKGRVIVDLGDLKEKAQKAKGPKQSLSEWIREAVRRRLG